MKPIFSILTLAIKFEWLFLAAIFLCFFSYRFVSFIFDKLPPPEYMFQKMLQISF